MLIKQFLSLNDLKSNQSDRNSESHGGILFWTYFVSRDIATCSVHLGDNFQDHLNFQIMLQDWLGVQFMEHRFKNQLYSQVNLVFRNLRESKLAADNHVVSPKVVITKSWHLFSNIRFLVSKLRHFVNGTLTLFFCLGNTNCDTMNNQIPGFVSPNWIKFGLVKFRNFEKSAGFLMVRLLGHGMKMHRCNFLKTSLDFCCNMYSHCTTYRIGVAICVTNCWKFAVLHAVVPGAVERDTFSYSVWGSIPSDKFVQSWFSGHPDWIINQ